MSRSFVITSIYIRVGSVVDTYGQSVRNQLSLQLSDRNTQVCEVFPVLCKRYKSCKGFVINTNH